MSSLQDLLERIFLSPDENRPRAGWRLFSQIAGHLSLTTILSLPVLLGAWLLHQNILVLTPGTLLANKVTETLSLVATIYFARRVLDKRTIKSLGLDKKRAVKDLLAGFGIGFLLMGGIFVGLSATGWLSLEGWIWEVETIPMVVLLIFLMGINFILVGFGEEFWVRGYIFQNLEDGLNTPWAVALSSGIFALLHILNPDAGLVSTIGIFFAGLFFAFAYLRTRQLWLPIGLHVGWNFFENTIFGFPVSGLDTMGLVRHTITGPDLVTGGAFGPEAGLILLPALALGFILVYFWTRK